MARRHEREQKAAQGSALRRHMSAVRANGLPVRLAEGTLLDEQTIRVRAAVLDHKIPCLAFAREERAHVNIQKGGLEAMGLQVGPWLVDLAPWRARRRTTIPIHVWWREGSAVRERHYPPCRHDARRRSARPRATGSRHPAATPNPPVRSPSRPPVGHGTNGVGPQEALGKAPTVHVRPFSRRASRPLDSARGPVPAAQPAP